MNSWAVHVSLFKAFPGVCGCRAAVTLGPFTLVRSRLPAPLPTSCRMPLSILGKGRAWILITVWGTQSRERRKKVSPAHATCGSLLWGLLWLCDPICRMGAAVPAWQRTQYRVPGMRAALLCKLCEGHFHLNCGKLKNTWDILQEKKKPWIIGDFMSQWNTQFYYLWWI